MDISANSYNRQYKYNPQFKAKIADKGIYAFEAINYFLQPKMPPPEVYRQYYILSKNNLPQMSVMRKSDAPKRDIKDVYKIFKDDFKYSYRYMSLKRFNNDMAVDNTSVVLLKSNDENLGYYSVIFKDKNMYISAVDIDPKYRNTRCGAKIITDCWECLTDIAKAHECDKISLHVSEKHKNLINLYKRLGFEFAGTKKEKYYDGSLSCYMEKDLTRK